MPTHTPEERLRRLREMGSLLGIQAGGGQGPTSVPQPGPPGPNASPPPTGNQQVQIPENVAGGRAPGPEEGGGVPREGTPPKLDFSDIIRDFIQFIRDNQGNRRAIETARDQVGSAIRDRIDEFKEQLRAFSQGRNSRLRDRLSGVQDEIQQQAGQVRDITQQRQQQAPQPQPGPTQGGNIPVPRGFDQGFGSDLSRDIKLGGLQDFVSRLTKTPGFRQQ